MQLLSNAVDGDHNTGGGACDSDGSMRGDGDSGSGLGVGDGDGYKRHKTSTTDLHDSDIRLQVCNEYSFLNSDGVLISHTHSLSHTHTHTLSLSLSLLPSPPLSIQDSHKESAKRPVVDSQTDHVTSNDTTPCMPTTASSQH